MDSKKIKTEKLTQLTYRIVVVTLLENLQITVLKQDGLPYQEDFHHTLRPGMH